jgi:hypothetical protein
VLHSQRLAGPAGLIGPPAPASGRSLAALNQQNTPKPSENSAHLART